MAFTTPDIETHLLCEVCEISCHQEVLQSSNVALLREASVLLHLHRPEPGLWNEGDIRLAFSLPGRDNMGQAVLWTHRP